MSDMDVTSGRRPNILIVDDSVMMRAMIRRVADLSGVGLGEVYEAGNGMEAMRVLETREVDAVFTDLNMPVMNGTQLLREIAQRDAWKHIVRVIVSTDGSTARRDEVRDLDVQFYVEKPFRPEVMRDVLCTVTARAHA